MSASEPCTCAECVKAGVRRPAVAPLGQTLHGKALEDYWQAREEFQAVIGRLKDSPLKAAALRLVKGAQ